MVEINFSKTTLSKAVELAQLYIEDQLVCGRTGEIAPIPYIAGPPGIGKSAVLAELTGNLKIKDTDKKFKFKADHPALRPLEMFSGIPDIRKKGDELVTVWSKPEVIDFPDKDGYYLWLMDDFHLVDPTKAQYGFELFTYRKLHNYRIPDGVAMILAGNLTKQAGAKNTLSPIINRLGIFRVGSPVEDWYEGYISGITLKDRIRVIEIDPDNVVDVHPAIVSFLLKNPEFANEAEDTKNPFGSLRSWTFVGRILSRYESKFGNLEYDDMRLIVQAHVTPKAASEFENYIRVYHKFDFAKPIEKGEFFNYSADQADRIIEIFASAFGVTRYFLNKVFSEEKPLKKDELVKAVDNYVKFFNDILKRFSDEPGVNGIMVNCLQQVISRTKKAAGKPASKEVLERIELKSGPEETTKSGKPAFNRTFVGTKIRANLGMM